MLKKLSTLFVACLAIGLAFVAADAMASGTGTPAAASSHNLFDYVFGTTQVTFYNVRTVIFILGGFGLVALAFFAIFGKLQWKWFAALCVGLAIVAAAGFIIDYATGGVNNTATNLHGMTSWQQQGGAADLGGQGW